MKKIQWAGLVLILVALISCGTAKNTTMPETKNEQAQQQLEHFPKTKKGYQRFVIVLPSRENTKEEADLKLELIPGKVMPTDCNTRSLNGKLDEKELKGWGYNYYEFQTNGSVVSTMMACPDNKKIEKFVGAKPTLIRYNSKLPVVVFVPEGYTLQYRVWKAGTPTDALIK